MSRAVSTAPDVVVLAGGISHERDISLRSGRRVADALTGFGWHVRVLDSDARLLPSLLERRPDVVWPALHGASGEDGTLRSFFDATGLTYVGSRGAAARLAWDKPAAKRLVGQAGGATPQWLSMTRDVFREVGAQAAIELIGTAFPEPVVKPARGGSAQGVTIVRDSGRLPRALMDAFTYGDELLVEERVDGTEIAVGVLEDEHGLHALPAVEIVPTGGVYGFEERYNAGETRFYTPARIAESAAAAAAELAVLAHRVLGLRHLSRIDLIVDAAGSPWFLEAQVSPGLTETSLLPQSLIASGGDLGQAYAALASRALAG